MSAEFFRRYIDIIQEASAPVNPEDDMFAPRQHQQIAQVFDQLAKDQFQFAQEEREEDDDPEAGEGYEDDGASYLEVAAAFRRGLALGLEAWSSLDTMLAENSAETVKDALGINLSELQDQLTESDDMFADRKHQQIAKALQELAQRYLMLARQADQEGNEEEKSEWMWEVNGYKRLARAFAKDLRTGIDAWSRDSTTVQDDSYERLRDEFGIDLRMMRQQLADVKSLREADDDMFAPRQHQQVAQVFDQLVQNQLQFAQEEREEENDPEAGRGYESDAEWYRDVAQAFRRGMQPGLEAWYDLDTMLREDSAETVEDAIGIDLYELQDQM